MRNLFLINFAHYCMFRDALTVSVKNPQCHQDRLWPFEILNSYLFNSVPLFRGFLHVFTPGQRFGDDRARNLELNGGLRTGLARTDTTVDLAQDELHRLMDIPRRWSYPGT